jgi:hypothetical protein
LLGPVAGGSDGGVDGGPSDAGIEDVDAGMNAGIAGAGE